MNKERNMKSARVEVLSELITVKNTNLETMKTEEEALKTAVEAMVSAPQEEFRRCVEELLKFSNADIKNLSKITKPSVGIRLCCEMLRTIFEPNFKPKRHAAETWQESVKFVSEKSFFIKLATCDADILSVDQMKILKKYVERAEFNANKIEHESIVCACLCRWISAFLELACTLRVMEEQVEESKELREQIKQTEEKCENETNEMQQLKNDVEKLTNLIRENEQTLANDRRLCDYRLRSGDLLTALEPHRKQWKSQLKQNEKKQNELIGNTLLFSIHRSHLLCQEKTVSSMCISMCSSHLNSVSVPFDSSVATPSNAINRIIRNLKTSRKFCLFISSSESLLLNLRTVLPSATYLDMSMLTWKDSQISLLLPKHIYSIVPTVFFNITEAPPPEMYEILMKSEEREVCYHNKSYELPDDILFVFVAKSISHIPDQIKKLMEVIVVSSNLDPIDDAEKTERNELASLLGEFTAADILESKELSRKAMQMATST
ncbi:hypothetical protein GCK72_010357 [Caenorhabditis remanei]|uniref:Dynein heavy chain coiled coil stalk domain-containing protein n=1 Tax=Caenorhabditis remanei TaxID=31234 RepID=A0A6A5H4Z3_CAERE|nr:hypothetical protein GCK72_010357 [Caenorhabditis remanei]KAF1762095.1 hypothetical protein GCK72_010357 [Caenorhabditis remanei]